MLWEGNNNHLLLFLKSQVQAGIKIAVTSLLDPGKSDRESEIVYLLLQQPSGAKPVRNSQLTYAEPVQGSMGMVRFCALLAAKCRSRSGDGSIGSPCGQRPLPYSPWPCRPGFPSIWHSWTGSRIRDILPPPATCSCCPVFVYQHLWEKMCSWNCLIMLLLLHPLFWPLSCSLVLHQIFALFQVFVHWRDFLWLSTNFWPAFAPRWLQCA